MASLTDTIAAHGLEAYRAAILAAERPCVYITLGAPTDPGSPGSRIGGHPFLPASVPWPSGASGRALTFVLQLDLADLSLLTGLPLRNSGLLSFFVDGGWPSARDVPFRCLCFDGDLEPRPGPTTNNDPAVDVFASLASHNLELHLGSDVPRWYSSDYAALASEMSEDEQQVFSEDLAWSVASGAAAGPLLGKLFGYPMGIGADPRSDAARDRGVEAERWRNLLTLSSCRALDLCIWDAGYFEVMILDTDLAAGRFANLYATIESS